jgi:hypothetical protein
VTELGVLPAKSAEHGAVNGQSDEVGELVIGMGGGGNRKSRKKGRAGKRKRPTREELVQPTPAAVKAGLPVDAAVGGAVQSATFDMKIDP